MYVNFIVIYICDTTQSPCNWIFFFIRGWQSLKEQPLSYWDQWYSINEKFQKLKVLGEDKRHINGFLYYFSII